MKTLLVLLMLLSFSVVAEPEVADQTIKWTWEHPTHREPLPASAVLQMPMLPDGEFFDAATELKGYRYWLNDVEQFNDANEHGLLTGNIYTHTFDKTWPDDFVCLKLITVDSLPPPGDRESAFTENSCKPLLMVDPVEVIMPPLPANSFTKIVITVEVR